MSSCRWHSWTCLQLQALSPPGLVQGWMLALDTPVVEFSGSTWGNGALNSVSAADAIPVLHRLSWESHSVPYSPTCQGYSLTQPTAVTPLQLSQLAICKSLLLPPRWNSFQVPFHPPLVLLAYQHPKPTSSRWTRSSGPGVLETLFRAGLELNTCCLKLCQLLIDESDECSAAWMPPQDTHL